MEEKRLKGIELLEVLIKDFDKENFQQLRDKIEEIIINCQNHSLELYDKVIKDFEEKEDYESCYRLLNMKNEITSLLKEKKCLEVQKQLLLQTFFELSVLCHYFDCSNDIMGCFSITNIISVSFDQKNHHLLCIDRCLVSEIKNIKHFNRLNPELLDQEGKISHNTLYCFSKDRKYFYTCKLICGNPDCTLGVDRKSILSFVYILENKLNEKIDKIEHDRKQLRIKNEIERHRKKKI